MQLPGASRRTTSCQALPSIFTTFPTKYVTGTPDIISDEECQRACDDGIEVVPLEKTDSCCAKMVSPGEEGKEVVTGQKPKMRVLVKPLSDNSSKPPCIWKRMSTRKRILILISVQVGLLAAVGVGLWLYKRSIFEQNRASEEMSDSTGYMPVADVAKIQTGAYAIQLSPPQLQSQACFENRYEGTTWNCMSDAFFQLTISNPRDDRSSLNDNSTIAMVELERLKTQSPISNIYEQQLNLEPTDLTTYSDPNTPNNGPAYRFIRSYNRTVFLPSSFTPINALSSQRANATGSPEVTDGDTLWRCTSEETLVKGFIFFNRTSSWTNETVVAWRYDPPRQIPIALFPHEFKLIELRKANAPAPYCELVEATGDKFRVRSPRIDLETTDPPFQPDPDDKKGQDMLFENVCRCQWMVQ